MTDWPILSLVTFLPLVGALLILFIRGDSENARRNIRAHRAVDDDRRPSSSRCSSGPASTTRKPGFQFVEKLAWLGSGISYHMGVDGISMLFVILTTFLMPLCILAQLGIDRRTASRNT